ncbi:DNA helicase RecQ [Alphaproteobacteria bacterium]|nr:DNA helicase RecQ [Alphaproteobacteria bacterium]
MNSSQLNERVAKVLKNVFGFSNYRNGQKEIIENILNEKQTLAIMPTGAGKSLCYQLPAVMSKKKTIVIAPLIALIEDQVFRLKECGVNVEQLHSNQSREELTSSWNNFKNGKSNIIYISPERLMTDNMINNLKAFEIGLFVIDEIHCISKWGQSFRPDYEKLSQLKNIFPKSNIVGFTATADYTTRLDIINKIFNNDTKVFVKGFDRPNLSLSINQKTNWKLQIIDFLNPRKDQSGIIYCLSRKKTEEVSSFLIEKGFNASAYHAGLDASVRKNVQNIFMTAQYHIVVATIAFGMGIDKPDIRFVLHLNLPGSMESYYQEIGRAGRDGKPADTLLIYGLDDLVIRRRMIEDSISENEYKLRENKRLDFLLSYSETPECRRKVLLAYFDDVPKSCNNCDNCLNPPKLIDGTVLAQKLLSTIYKTGQYFGQAHVINVIRGSEDKKIIQRGHQHLSVYGIGKDKSKDFWQSFLRQLLAYGHLQINFQKYGAVQISDIGVELLKNKKSFFYKDILVKIDKKLRKNIRYENKDISNENLNLLNALKALRLNIAKKNNLPAYTVFHDSSLIQMSQIKPNNQLDMLKIDGVGEVKFKKYGELFIDKIAEYF